LIASSVYTYWREAPLFRSIVRMRLLKPIRPDGKEVAAQLSPGFGSAAGPASWMRAFLHQAAHQRAPVRRDGKALHAAIRLPPRLIEVRVELARRAVRVNVGTRVLDLEPGGHGCAMGEKWARVA